MKKFVPLMALGSTLVIAGCGGGTETSGSEDGGGAPSHELQVGIVVSESDPMYEGLESFKQNVEERTNGDLAIEIFPDSSLGDTAEIQEQAITGANVGTLADAGIMADYHPEIGILQGPYLFEDYEDIQSVTDSELFTEWEEDLSSNQNLQILSFNWYQGARHMVTQNEINTPEDMNGQSIRTIGADVFLETMEAMGANPTGLDWAEVYPGIQQGVIDGAEAQHSATHGASLFEVADYISKTNHIQLITGLVVGAEWFNNLPEDYQMIVTEEAEAAGIEASNIVIEGAEEYESLMEEEGMTIVEPDLEPFQEATENVYEEFENYPEIREEIMEITEN